MLAKLIAATFMLTFLVSQALAQSIRLTRETMLSIPQLCARSKAECGPVSLRLTGREGVKDFIREEISGLGTRSVGQANHLMALTHAGSDNHVLVKVPQLGRISNTAPELRSCSGTLK